MRKHYIDNLRNITILLLFPVHTFMVWNDFGSKFYIWQGGNRLLSTLIAAINPWFMPLLFVISGISARYSLEKRTNKEFAVQRFEKLFIPFVFGIVFLVPFQTLFARKFFYGYNGGIFDNLKYFFTHLTDFSGYDGAFSPGQLWFILFLFIISMLSIVVFKAIPYEKIKNNIEKLPAAAVILLFVPIWLMYYIGNFGGFSLGKSFALFLLGYYVLSNDAVIKKLEKNIIWLSVLSAASVAAEVLLYYNSAYYGDLLVNFVGWVCILTLLVSAKRFLNKKTAFTDYFNKASYPIYILHQSVLVALAFYTVRFSDIIWIQALCICLGSFVITVSVYSLIKLIPVLRKAVGIK